MTILRIVVKLSLFLPEFKKKVSINIANILHIFFQENIFVLCKPDVEVQIFENCE